MTQEEKELLLKDLCARLPYGVIIDNPNPAGDAWDEAISIDTTTKTITLLYNGRTFSIADIKPYLRPMSSMTKEERIEFTKLFYKWYDDELFDYAEEGAEFSIWKHKGISPVVFDWLNEHHFDYRGLIEKGLALEAPEGMYKTE